MLASAEKKSRAPRRATVRKLLTDKFVTNLKAAKKGDRTVIYDTVVTGLAVSVTDSGAKSWILNTRYPTEKGWRPAKRSLGLVGKMSLALAREKAREWHELLATGCDPQLQEDMAQASHERMVANTFGMAAEQYIKRKVRPRRRGVKDEAEIRKLLITEWGSKPLGLIYEDTVRRYVIKLRDERATSAARAALVHTKMIFDFAIEEGDYGLQHSPCDRIKPHKLLGQKKSRQRVLNGPEIKAYWQAAETLGWPWREFYHLLMLTGQRKSDVASMVRREFNWPRDVDTDWSDALWVIPEARFKSGRDQRVPLSPDAQAILQGLPTLTGTFMLSTTGGKKAINGFSKSKAALDKAMAKILGYEPEPWVQHDVRRTVRTRLSELKVPSEVAELIIGHGKRGLAVIYDQHQYIDEMRAGLNDWAARLRQLVQ